MPSFMRLQSALARLAVELVDRARRALAQPRETRATPVASQDHVRAPSTNDDAQSGTSPTPLSGQQQALLKALEDRDSNLANMYLGGLKALDSSTNPERYAQAAHSMRELMEKLPRLLDVPLTAHGERLGDRVVQVGQVFKSTQSKSTCRAEDGSWSGEIDQHLRSMLQRLDQFFNWFDDHFPRRKQEIHNALVRLEGSGRELPPKLASLKVDAWERYRVFFQSVAHHGRQTDEDAMRRQIGELELFLLDQFLPRTFEDFGEIDALLAEEGEQ